MIDVILDGDGAFKHWKGQKIYHETSMKISYLEKGTKDGNPSMVIGIELNETGQKILIEATLKEFLVAADLLAIRQFRDV